MNFTCYSMNQHSKGPSRPGLFCISTSDADANGASASQNGDAFDDPLMSGSVHLRTSITLCGAASVHRERVLLTRSPNG